MANGPYDPVYNATLVWVEGTNFPAVDRQLLGMWFGFLFQNPMLGGFLSYLSSWGKYAHAEDICTDNETAVENCVIGPFGLIDATNSSLWSQENRNFTQLFTDPVEFYFFAVLGYMLYLALDPKKHRKTSTLWDLINPISLRWTLNEGFLLVVYVLVWLLTEWLHSLPDTDQGRLWINYGVHTAAFGYAPFLVSTLYKFYVSLLARCVDTSKSNEILSGSFDPDDEDKYDGFLSRCNGADKFLRGDNPAKLNFYNATAMVIIPIVWEILCSTGEVEHDWHGQRNALFVIYVVLVFLISNPKKWIKDSGDLELQKPLQSRTKYRKVLV